MDCRRNFVDKVGKLYPEIPLIKEIADLYFDSNWDITIVIRRMILRLQGCLPSWQPVWGNTKAMNVKPGSFDAIRRRAQARASRVRGSFDADRLGSDVADGYRAPHSRSEADSD